MCVRNLWQKYTAIMMSKDSTKLQFQERKYLPDGCPQRSLRLMQDQLMIVSFCGCSIIRYQRLVCFHA